MASWAAVERLDDETRERDLANIRAIRARLSQQAAPMFGDGTASRRGRPMAKPSLPASSSLDDPHVMAAQMAAAALREGLERRVAELTAENDRLRAALAEVLAVVAGTMMPIDAAPGERSPS